MMYAADFREKARDGLRGNWGKAVGVGVVASLLTGGAMVTNTGAGGEAGGYLSFADHGFMITMTTVAVVMSLIAIVIGGAVNLGWCRFHTNLVKEREDAYFNDLFAHFDRLGRGFVMNVVVSLFILLWSLLFVIPGVILIYVAMEASAELGLLAAFPVILICVVLTVFVSYRYAMVPYLMAEFTELKTMDAVRESKRLMQGNKWRLFCLQLSFMGWAVLCVLTLGIGNLWLTPYMRTAEAAFYMHITGRLDKDVFVQSPAELP